ncbi:MAG TPA: hypothetical protein VEH78_00145 [Pseudolabrys sp.]|nr:hypothetical protein [Pseudolabrys sp.]
MATGASPFAAIFPGSYCPAWFILPGKIGRYEPLHLCLEGIAASPAASEGGVEMAGMMETKMSVQALTTIGGIRERTGFSPAALPILVEPTNELRKAFLAQLLTILVNCINKHGKIFVVRGMNGLKETRRQGVARVIHTYRHLIHGDILTD